VILTNGEKVPVSIRKREILAKLLKGKIQ